MSQYYSVKEIRTNPKKCGFTKQDAGNKKTWILEEDFIFNLLKDTNRDIKILDIGCWSGYFLNRLYEIGFRSLYGVDVMDQAENKNFEFHQVDMNMDNLPFPDKSFDVVSSFQTIEHLENYFHILHEVTRVLKPGGLFIMSVPNPFNIIQRVKFLISGNLSSWNIGNDHLLFLTKDVFKKTYLRKFDLIKTHYGKGMVPFWGRLNILPFVQVGCRKALLPRGRLFGFRVCYILRLKEGVK